ncbi:MAG: DUF3696 domain-containing protein [Kiritimatiellae bacterium]|nr:DUF3696 domain-containing protein [Kiritimatiellia bacterium]
MIRNLELINFKCYKTATIGFAPLTVFAGMNAVGKSTAMQALAFLRQSFFSRDAMAGVPVNGPLVSFGQMDDLLYSHVEARNADAVLGVGVEFSVGAGKVGFEGRRVPNDESTIDAGQTVSVKRFEGVKTDEALFSGDFAYLCADRVGPRTAFRAPTADEQKINRFGNRGEFCAWHLASRKLSRLLLPELVIENNGVVANSLIQQVSAWMGRMGRPLRVSADMNERQRSAWLSFSFLEGNDGYGMDYSPANVGFGLTYSLPVFVVLLSLPRGGLALIENPEAHLHPHGQVAMGEFISKVAASGVQVVVETHSDHVLNGIRLAVKKEVIPDGCVKLNFVAKGGGESAVEIVSPRILPSGAIDIWPEGFFDEYENTLADLI